MIIQRYAILQAIFLSRRSFNTLNSRFHFVWILRRKLSVLDQAEKKQTIKAVTQSFAKLCMTVFIVVTLLSFLLCFYVSAESVNNKLPGKKSVCKVDEKRVNFEKLQMAPIIRILRIGTSYSTQRLLKSCDLRISGLICEIWLIELHYCSP